MKNQICLRHIHGDDNNSLKHHGIMGMHWGKKHGPPYPLDDKVSSKIKKVGASELVNKKNELHGKLKASNGVKSLITDFNNKSEKYINKKKYKKAAEYKAKATILQEIDKELNKEIKKARKELKDKVRSYETEGGSKLTKALLIGFGDVKVKLLKEPDFSKGSKYIGRDIASMLLNNKEIRNAYKNIKPEVFATIQKAASSKIYKDSVEKSIKNMDLSKMLSNARKRHNYINNNYLNSMMAQQAMEDAQRAAQIAVEHHMQNVNLVNQMNHLTVMNMNMHAMGLM